MEIRFLSEIVDSNTTIGLTETWLDETCDHETYSFCKTTHEILRCDRNKKCTGQHAGAGTLLIIPKKFNPKIREDLNYLRPPILKDFGWNIAQSSQKNQKGR